MSQYPKARPSQRIRSAAAVYTATGGRVELRTEGLGVVVALVAADDPGTEMVLSLGTARDLAGLLAAMIDAAERGDPFASTPPKPRA